MHHTLSPILPAAMAIAPATAAAVMDVRTRRIPNRLVVVSAVAALATQLILGGWRGVAGAAVAATLAFALMSVGFFLGGVGAGDVKLLSAMAAFSGLPLLPLLLTSTALAGGLLALVALARKAHARRSLHQTVLFHDNPSRRLTLPYAVAIGCGVFSVFCHALWSLG